ncbi:hypothetical protein ACFYQ5_20080 [Streptomyces sp. NPDC005794]|uniref:caspase, EACC1-associated type n=1 Tax=Streptomyces sp. NPDC005794 TaxID=3364733 RepID=UPI0036CCBCED
MTDEGTGLARSGAHAVLIGTGHHVPGSQLPDLPAVATTLDDLESALRDVCGITGPDRIHRVREGAAAAEVIASVERAVAEATGPVLLYYVGHGLLGPADELYLATYASSDQERISGAVSYRTLRDLLSDAFGGSIVVLDCCFSGRAAAPAGGAGQAWEPFASARPDGSLLLTSASGYDLSFAPPGERHTLFSGRLLELLTTGDPTGPLWLTMDSLYVALDRHFRDEPVRPRRQGEGTLGTLPVARNRAYRATGATAPVLPPADVPCPYPGMETFSPAESSHFFGRDELTERLLDAVCAPDAEIPVVVVGASGVGKSSLLRAGLLAGLERRHAGAPAPELWPALLLAAPGAKPVRALAELWGRATGLDPAAVHEQLAASDGRLPEPLPGRVPCRLLVVDQFEEIFTRCEDAAERERFIELLATGPRVVLGLRADLYGSCLAHPLLVRALRHGQVTVPPMTGDELRAVIERPARAVGLTLEAGLTGRLLHDLRTAPDAESALPFLAHALRETWLARSGTALTLAGYQTTGGIWHSITTTMESLYQELDPDGQEVLRELLMRLIHLTAPGAEGSEAVVRRRVDQATLLYGFTPPQRRAAAAIRDRLAAARLITVDRDGAQISHEALLRAWSRLRRWINEDRDGLVARQRLTEAAQAWEAAERHPDFHLRGGRLEDARALLREERLRHRQLPRLDQQFLTASHDAERAEQTHEARRARRLKGALAGVALGLCLALIATSVALHQRSTAREQRTVALQRALVEGARSERDEHPLLSLRLGLAADELKPTTEARAAIVDTLTRTNALASSADDRKVHDQPMLNHNGTLEASVDKNDAVALWRITDKAARTRLAVRPTGCTVVHDSLAASTFAFSGDGRILAGMCEEGTVALWSIADPPTAGVLPSVATLQLPRLNRRPDGVAFSADGTLLAVAGQDSTHGAVGLWDIREPGAPRRLAVLRDVYDSSSVLFSPDGRTLVSSTDLVTFKEEPKDRNSLVSGSGSTFWDITDPSEPRNLTRLPKMGEHMTFSPDSRYYAATEGNRVHVWDVRTPAKPVPVADWPAQRGPMTTMAFSPDGTRLATAGDVSDSSVALYDMRVLPRSKALARFVGHSGGVRTMAFTSDGKRLTSLDDDGRVLRWDLERWGYPTSVHTVTGGGPALAAAAFTPDGRTLATGGWGQDVTLWDLTDPRRSKRTAVIPGEGFVWGIAISPDGRTLAVGYVRAGIRLWDISDRARPQAGVMSPEGERLSTFLQLSATGGAVAPDGKLLTVNGHQLREPNGGSSDVVELPGSHGTSSFSPDGSVLATQGYDHDVMLWDVTQPRKPRRVGSVPETGKEIGEVAFHPGGTLVAGLQSTGEVGLWNVADPARIHQAALLNGHNKEVMDIAFRPDGRYAVTVSRDGGALVWDLGRLPEITADPIAMACMVAGGGLTREEWKKRVPGAPYVDTCA